MRGGTLPRPVRRTRMKWATAATTLVLLAGCARESADGTEQPDAQPSRPARTAVAASPSPPAEDRRLVGEAVVLAQWREADNREHCVPLAFTGTGGARGAPRPAEFAGGWGVAFDLPELRSAFGVAGPGLVAADDAAEEAQRRRLHEQWPYFRDLAALPEPAFAGYGVEGGAAYPAGNPNGRGVNSLAYVRVDGQRCTYNVWSRLGRRHLETLLDGLRPVPTG